MSLIMRIAIAVGVVILVGGCGILPQVVHQPTYHNPFPQLAKVAIAPFFNASTEPTVDGREFALAYFNELQAIPGFEVVPVGIVEEKIRQCRLSLGNPAEVRKLAQMLEVDAIVIGAVTDFSPYYPPRCAMQIEWYAANPNFHPIPVGYGLPWNTPEEEFIPGPLVQATEFELAREQLKTQTPPYQPDALIPVQSDGKQPKSGTVIAMIASKGGAGSNGNAGDNGARPRQDTARLPVRDLRQLGTAEQPPEKIAMGGPPAPLSEDSTDGGAGVAAPAQEKIAASANGQAGAVRQASAEMEINELPPNWPDPRGLIPPAPSAVPVVGEPTYEPVLRHTRTYNGNDVQFTTALESYVIFRDDARMGGWQSYLQRSDDFIRFCCHLSVTEMLTARGGAGETRVVWKWANRR